MHLPFASSSNTTHKNRTPTMKTILLLLNAIIFTAAARADEQVISTFSWKELADAVILDFKRIVRCAGK